MFGVKLNKHTFRQAIGKAKNIAGNVYLNTKNVLGDIDTGIKSAKKIYSIVSPILETAVGKEQFNKANKYLMKSLGGYENLRSRVMEGDEQAANTYNQVVGGLKKNKIDIGL